MEPPPPPPVDSGVTASAPPATRGPSLSFWRRQISLAVARRQQVEPWWEANLKAYAPGVDESPAVYGSHVNTNRDFVLVERKKADLFYQRPEVTLAPSPLLELPLPQLDPATGQPAKDPQTGQPVTVSQVPAITAHEQILNQALGPAGVDAVGLVHRALFDVLCTAGVGATVLGYESVTVPVAQPGPPDPLTGLPGPDVSVPVPVYERVFWQPVSPKRLIIPHDLTSTQWDEAPFLGFTFTLPLTPQTRAKYQLPPDFVGAAPGDESRFTAAGPVGAEATRPVFTGTELWYRSSLFRDDVAHPEHLTHLVVVDGLDRPAIEEDCPHQAFDDRGRLTPDSLRGFPIHLLNLRVMTDAAYVPSDCTIIRPLVNELNVFRRQMVEYRDAQTLRWSYNTDVLPPDALGKIVRAPIGGMIGLPAEAFVGEGAIRELPHGSMPRESFTSNDYIDNDIARTTAIDAAGAGVQSTGSSTATEQQIIQANANARLDFERGRVLEWYLAGVTKFSTLLQRYWPTERAVEVVGPEAATAWDGWRHRVPAALSFTALPDSALRVDQAVDRRQAQELYTYLANDPYMAKGRPKLLEKLLRKFHIDPAGIVAPPDPPKPAPPGLAFSFKGEDLVGPQAPIVLEIAQQLGLQVSPAAIQLSQQMFASAQALAQAEAHATAGPQGATQHGGKLAPMATLDKHQADAGLGMQGLGGIATGGGAVQ